LFAIYLLSLDCFYRPGSAGARARIRAISKFIEIDATSSTVPTALGNQEAEIVSSKF